MPYTSNPVYSRTSLCVMSTERLSEWESEGEALGYDEL